MYLLVLGDAFIAQKKKNLKVKNKKKKEEEKNNEENYRIFKRT